ncbi:MAG: hypothetical protein CL441_09295 [Acidimicrobiaceae bacterium]|nr:hypothetical protein [Acidimicrobiaceae bacterium]
MRVTAALVLLLGAIAPLAGAQPVEATWQYFGGDEAFTRYSPLDQIDRDTVADLEVVWRRPGIDPELQEVFPDLSVSAYLRSTPVLVDGVLYAPNAVGLVEAFDPATGETVWRQPPFTASLEEVAGTSTRGVALWASGDERRLLLVRGEYLYALDPATGRRIPGFGLPDQGRASLHWDRPLAGRFSWSGGPIVVGDVVVVAGITGGAGDGGVVREAASEDIRGFDVRTGELLWTFHVVPRDGEFGADTWGDGSAAYSGDLGSWCCLTADEELGYVYVPLSAPTGMVYGGHRPGDNLFSDSLVALDARTGERVWHFQMVHHDVWEYDTVGPPTLGDITVDGRRIKAVMQPSKTAFLYVFDRETGEPVWPIEERKVPQSIVPGERTSSTQPFPTKPPPFDLQGITEDDLIDFTPSSAPTRWRRSRGWCWGRSSRHPGRRATTPMESRGRSPLREAGAPATGTPVRSTPRPATTTRCRTRCRPCGASRRPTMTMPRWTGPPRGRWTRLGRTGCRSPSLPTDGSPPSTSTVANWRGWRPTATGRSTIRDCAPSTCRRSAFPTAQRRW